MDHPLGHGEERDARIVALGLEATSDLLEDYETRLLLRDIARVRGGELPAYQWGPAPQLCDQITALHPGNGQRWVRVGLYRARCET